MSLLRRSAMCLVPLVALLAFVPLAMAQDPPAATAAPAPAPGPSTADLKVALDTVWVMVGGMLVFFMNLGFGCVESGFCRAKNCVNILSKNFVVFAVSTSRYWFIGWGLMFGNGNDVLSARKVCGSSAVSPRMGRRQQPGHRRRLHRRLTAPSAGPAFRSGPSSSSNSCSPEPPRRSSRVPWPSGSSTSRSSCSAVCMAIVIYPVVGHWIWGGGWLATGRLLGLRRFYAGPLGRRLGCLDGRPVSSAPVSASTVRTARSTRFPATT